MRSLFSLFLLVLLASCCRAKLPQAHRHHPHSWRLVSADFGASQRQFRSDKGELIAFTMPPYADHEASWR